MSKYLWTIVAIGHTGGGGTVVKQNGRWKFRVVKLDNFSLFDSK